MENSHKQVTAGPRDLIMKFDHENWYKKLGEGSRKKTTYLMAMPQAWNQMVVLANTAQRCVTLSWGQTVFHHPCRGRKWLDCSSSRPQNRSPSFPHTTVCLPSFIPHTGRLFPQRYSWEKLGLWTDLITAFFFCSEKSSNENLLLEQIPEKQRGGSDRKVRHDLLLQSACKFISFPVWVGAYFLFVSLFCCVYGVEWEQGGSSFLFVGWLVLFLCGVSSTKCYCVSYLCVYLLNRGREN